MSEVKFIKLVTGEEFFSTVTRKEKDFKMENSVVAVDNGEGGLAFVPQLPFFEGRTFHVHADDVMIVETPINEIVNSYNQNFGSGIITPPEKKIIT